MLSYAYIAIFEHSFAMFRILFCQFIFINYISFSQGKFSRNRKYCPCFFWQTNFHQPETEVKPCTHALAVFTLVTGASTLVDTHMRLQPPRKPLTSQPQKDSNWTCSTLVVVSWHMRVPRRPSQIWHLQFVQPLRSTSPITAGWKSSQSRGHSMFAQRLH